MNKNKQTWKNLMKEIKAEEKIIKREVNISTNIILAIPI